MVLHKIYLIARIDKQCRNSVLPEVQSGTNNHKEAEWPPSCPTAWEEQKQD